MLLITLNNLLINDNSLVQRKTVGASRIRSIDVTNFICPAVVEFSRPKIVWVNDLHASGRYLRLQFSTLREGNDRSFTTLLPQQPWQNKCTVVLPFVV